MKCNYITNLHMLAFTCKKINNCSTSPYKKHRTTPTDDGYSRMCKKQWQEVVRYCRHAAEYLVSRVITTYRTKNGMQDGHWWTGKVFIVVYLEVKCSFPFNSRHISIPRRRQFRLYVHEYRMHLKCNPIYRNFAGYLKWHESNRAYTDYLTARQYISL